MEKRIPEHFESLYDDLKKYLDVKFDYYKLDIIERIITISTYLFKILLAIVIIPMIIFFISFTAAYFIGEMLGSVWMGFGIIVVVLVLLGLIVYLLRNLILTRPLIHALVDAFFESPKTKQVKNVKKERIQKNKDSKRYKKEKANP